MTYESNNSEFKTSVTSIEQNEKYRDVTCERVAAAVIDLILMTLLLVVLSGIFGTVAGNAVFFQDGMINLYSGSSNPEGLPFYVYLLLFLSYHGVMEGFFGATVGKLVLGLRVVKIDGSACGWTRVFLRSAFRVVDGLPIFYLLGIIVVLMTPKSQRLGDLVAGTVLVAKADLQAKPADQPSEDSDDQNHHVDTDLSELSALR